MGSDGSKELKGMPAAWAAASRAALEAEAAALDEEEGLDLDRGGAWTLLVKGEALEGSWCPRPLLSPQWLSSPLLGVSRPRFMGSL